MKTLLAIPIVSLTLTGLFHAWAGERPQSHDPPSTVDQPKDAAVLDAIQSTVASFQAAFDKGDAQAVADHWTSDGELVVEDGRRFQGREAIAKAYNEFFAAHPGARLTSKIEHLRLVSPDTAIEDGTSAASVPGSPPTNGRYTAVHVKQDGKWLIASVRESAVESSSSLGHLASLEGLIGTWVADNNGVEYQAKSHWIADKNFIEQSFQSHKGKRVISSGTQIIGWDPVNQCIASWTFSSDGGHAKSLWQPADSGWVVESAGTMNDGTPISAINILTLLDDNAIAWRSVERTAGAFRVLDTDEVVLTRKPAEGK